MLKMSILHKSINRLGSIPLRIVIVFTDTEIS